VQAVGDSVKAAVFAEVGLIEDIANVDLDVADHGAHRLEFGIARHAGRPGLIDPGVLEVREPRRNADFGQRRGQYHQRC
jgi:hypothetical protein